MHALIYGVTRDQFMGRHRANHLNVAYAPVAGTADKAMMAKAALFPEAWGGSAFCGRDSGYCRVHGLLLSDGNGPLRPCRAVSHDSKEEEWRSQEQGIS
jgi:hypothetical protein